MCDLSAQIALVLLERRDHLFDVAAAERNHIDLLLPQVRRHAHLRHGDEMAFEHRIVDVAARQHFRECVTDQLANAQRALGGACLMLAVALMSPTHALNTMTRPPATFSSPSNSI